MSKELKFQPVGFYFETNKNKYTNDSNMTRIIDHLPSVWLTRNRI